MYLQMKFETFKRSPEISIVEYITEFERLYNIIQVHDMKYADGVLAYKLLINANISEEKQSMCRATMGKLTFENIKKQMKVIHDCTGIDVARGTNDTSSVIVKKELVFEAERSEYGSFYTHSNRPGRGWRGFRGSFRGKFRGNYRGAGAPGRKEPIQSIRSNDGTRIDERKYTRSEERMVKRKNPTDSCGKVTTCNLCGSVYHWVRNCPERESYEEDRINLFSNEIQREYLPIFLKESLNCAVLDCGCVRSVCGKKWLESYVKSLTPDKG